jgi:hypothetical protein
MMRSWYFSRPYWLYWTVAGRGARDGRINHPKNGVVQQIRPEIGQLDRLGEFLREIEIALVPRPDRDGSTSAQVDTSDYDCALRALEAIMEARGVPLDSLAASGRRELVKMMVDLIDRHEKSKRDDPNALTHYESELLAIAEEKIEGLCAYWETRHNTIEAKAGQVRHEWLNANEEFEAIKKQHQEKKYRQPHPLLPGWLYYCILIGLGLAEYWVNMIAFRLFFVPGYELYVSALLPAIVIPFFAHVVGTQLRYWQGKKELNIKVRWQSVVIVIGSLMIALATASALVWLRSSYFSFELRQPIDLKDAASILMLNIAGLCAGIAAAYIAHDVDSELENICKQKEYLMMRLHRVWRRWAALSSEFDKMRGQFIAEIGKIRYDTIAKIAEYRDYNIRYRMDDSIPSIFAAQVGDRFFRPRDFSHELSHTPPPIEELRAIYRTASGEYRAGGESSQTVESTEVGRPRVVADEAA